MKLFISSLTSEISPIEKIPISITYVSTRSTTTGTGNHIQGFVIDEPNDMVYISWSYGIAKYRWSTLTIVDSISLEYHTGDLTMVGNYLYVCVSGSARRTYEINKDTMTTNRSVLGANFDYYLGGYGYDTNTGKLWGGYGSGLIDDGVLQEVNLTTLEPVTGSTITFLNTSTPTDFGDGIQSLCFMPNSPDYIAFCDYNKDASAAAGSNVKFAKISDLSYDLVRNFQLPVDYGVSVVGDKLYLIQKGGGTATAITDILEFDINY